MLRSILGALLGALIWVVLPMFAAAQDTPTSPTQPNTAQQYSGTSVDELRAREIGRSLRCVVCQNQSIEESNAPLAADMRILVRKQIAQGDSNQKILDNMQNTYGDFVLLKPPFQANTLVLWLLPFLILLAGLIWFVRVKKKTVHAKGNALSPQEQEQLDALLSSQAPEATKTEK